jgi:hypothetical protein
MGSKSGIDGVIDVAVVSTAGGGAGGGGAVTLSSGAAVAGALVDVVAGTSTLSSALAAQTSGLSTALTTQTANLSTALSSIHGQQGTNYVTPDGRNVVVQSNAAILFSDDFGSAAGSAANWTVLDGGLPANPNLGAGTLTQSAIGSGTDMGNGTNTLAGNSAIAFANSSITLTMGTTAGAELWLLSTQAFAGTEDLFFTFLKSQALAANSIEIGLVEVDAATGCPKYNAGAPTFTVNAVVVPAWFTNAGLVQLGCQTANTSYAACAIGDASSAGAVGSTGTALAALTANSEFIVEFHAEDLIASNGATDSAAAKNVAPSRVSSQCPNDGRVYKLLIRLRNIGAPGSSTTVSLGRAMIWDSQELRVEVASGRGDANAQKGVGVNLAGVATGVTVPVSFTDTSAVQVRPNSAGGCSVARITGNAANPYGSVKSSSGQIYGYDLTNTNAATRYVHLYNQTTQPTLGASTPIFTIAIPTGQRASWSSDVGFSFSTGIEWQITTDDNTVPTTAGAAGDVVGTVIYL